MEPRSTLKSLRKFAVQELKEKRANRVCVRRVKMESLMRRGQLPDLRVRMIEGTNYLVCVFRGDELRLYHMDKRGVLLGASEFKGAEKENVWADISKRTKNVFHVPT